MNSIVLNMPDSEYRKAPGLSQSALKEFAISPARYKASLLEKREVTPAMAMGILVDELLFTPDEPSRIAIRPEGLDMRTKDGKAWKAANAHLEADVTREQSIEANWMVRSIRYHAMAGKAFACGKAQVSCFREYTAANGRTIQLKGRLDFVNDGNAIVDLKTCEDARPWQFAKHAEAYGYFTQAAFYADFLWNPLCEALGTPSEQKSQSVIVAVEKRAPFDVMVYSVSEATRSNYGIQIRAMLDRYAECEASGQWPGYPTEIQELEPPKWASGI